MQFSTEMLLYKMLGLKNYIYILMAISAILTSLMLPSKEISNIYEHSWCFRGFFTSLRVLNLSFQAALEVSL